MLNPELAADMKIEQDPFLFELDYDCLELPALTSFTSSEYYPLFKKGFIFCSS